MENCSRTYNLYVIFTEIKIESKRWNWNILSRIIKLVLSLTICQNLRVILFRMYFIIFIEKSNNSKYRNAVMKIAMLQAVSW